MANQNIFEITFKGTEELSKMAEQKQQLLDLNVKAAVIRTVLWGATKIAEDINVDTGRLRSSILGYLAEKYGITLEGDPEAINEGLNLSVTGVEGYEGRIGTNVKYALPYEYGHNLKVAKNPKNIHKRINKRAGMVGRVKGKGAFRKNIPLIDRYFQEQMRDAITYTERGELMPVTF